MRASVAKFGPKLQGAAPICATCPVRLSSLEQETYFDETTVWENVGVGKTVGPEDAVGVNK
jgi:hypothetical protein